MNEWTKRTASIEAGIISKALRTRCGNTTDWTHGTEIVAVPKGVDPTEFQEAMQQFLVDNGIHTPDAVKPVVKSHGAGDAAINADDWQIQVHSGSYMRAYDTHIKNKAASSPSPA